MTFFKVNSFQNASVCSDTILNYTSTNAYGVMTSPNYPIFEPFINCVRNIIVPISRVLRVYVTYIYIGEPDEETGE